MIFIDCEQGTEEWHLARCATITASRFADAIKMVGGLDERQTAYVEAVRSGVGHKDAALAAGYKVKPSSAIVMRALEGKETRSPSDEAVRYSCDIAIERISNRPHGEPPKAWVLARGHEMEVKARMAYEVLTGAMATEAGICKTNCGIFGYSTDGFVDDDGLIEIKAPIDSQKIMTMLETGDVSEYIHQMQGGMWITGRMWCDFIMYVPELESVGKALYIKRIHRDDVFIDAMVESLMLFERMASRNEAILRMPTAA